MADLGQAAAWHRQIAALAAAADRVGVAGAELPGIRARLVAQQARFAQAASRLGAPLPALMPSAGEIATAAPAFGDLSPAAIGHALRTASSTLDATDAVLTAYLVPQPQPAMPAPPVGQAGPPPGQSGPPDATQPTPPPTGMPPTGIPPTGTPPSGIAAWPAGLRNGLVYGAYAVGVLAVQLALFLLLDEESALPLMAPVCLFVLPAFAWAAGWFTVGAVFRSPPGAPPTNRTPRLGAIIVLLPDALYCAGFLALLIAR